MLRLDVTCSFKARADYRDKVNTGLKM